MLVVMVVVASAFFRFSYKEPVDFIQKYSERVLLLKQYIESKENADVVLMGSSLMLLASYNSDLDFFKREYGKIIYDVHLITHMDSYYFKHLLEKHFKGPMKVKNLSFIAATPRDVELLISGMIESGSKPSTIVYGIAPRMMADNLTPLKGAIGGETVLNLESSKRSSKWNFLESTKSKLLSNPEILQTYRDYSLIGDSPTFDQTMDFLLSRFWYFYKCRNEISMQIKKEAESLFSDRTTPRQSNTSQKVENTDAKHTLKKNKEVLAHPNPEKFQIDLDHYNSCYNPPDFIKFKKNCQYFENLTILCKNQGVKLVIVKMPLTLKNRKLVSKNFMLAYTKFIEDLCKKYDVSLLDFSAAFPNSKFSDSVHLNGSGSTEFFQKLTNELKSL